jgi:hypothetical protein
VRGTFTTAIRIGRDGRYRNRRPTTRPRHDPPQSPFPTPEGDHRRPDR